MTSIAKLPGVGPALARILSENGYATIETVAGKSPQELSKIPRIGKLRAARLSAEAKKAHGETSPEQGKPARRANGDAPAMPNGAVQEKSVDRAEADKLSSALAAAEAARRAAEAKAEKAVLKAKKSAKKAAALAEEFAAAKVKAKAKAKRVKAKAKRAIEKEKAKAKAILEAKHNPKKEAPSKDSGKKDSGKKDASPKAPTKKASAKKDAAKKSVAKKQPDPGVAVKSKKKK
ncbi:helix-hairpin-helix domain-containing protein [Phaeobacter gallaeciensis]|uniref:Helix-hairpin-helix domain protein n=1 Tax=Phaeobacter gallaeciensis TaxID=60890 RepID=A0AAD0EB27_9RHOB|nr:helix-hairpin-helix domain-containing protein [Phaeobacter gallaeciensis]AHD09259.1 Helix-hairpin-helix domain protein [Phaeobacter gallaeciensis DSM 26640]ATE92522.1 Helix-hairpin-helix domain protein [Phaeobacter gallaeciensis]ATE97656.1 Helix-hairpin-helix domain protein [Phaeobacter gallaeciensis]ATF01187.1 Helix-hairpin-helix domain protein [Phaeobacter gallaeciensis]ATF05567.1 Helix-hairpin-helix domain protein [Phaeobacter gallaeciensis]